MQVPDALKLIEGVSYKPGWSFSAINYERNAGCVLLRVKYEVPNSDVRYAPEYAEPVAPVPSMDFILSAFDCHTDTDVYGKVIECLLQVERHEAREFFAVNGTDYDKPFHPHTPTGTTNWACRKPVVEMEDMMLGVMSYA